jgi:uncharacterized heparinase superfamily protein
MKKLALYFHTLKYLKFTQLYHRVLKRFTHPKINLIKGERADISGQWQVQELCTQKFINETDVNFLNHPGFVNSAVDWNNEKEEKLWLYNLHYFDDLNSFGSQSRQPLQRYWIKKWIDENPAIKGGNGWESYTLSLRIVNWSKAFLSGLEADDKMLNSLVQQADFLSQDLERHILGNHLFVNAKALIFAGVYLEGIEAESYLKIGLDIYAKELDEQVLPDGGNFELTPMYHIIMLVDLFDLINLWSAYPNKVNVSIVEKTKQIATKMLGWLKIMSHNDGEISFFNDTAFGIAPKSSVVLEYATKLELYNPQVSPVCSEKLSLFNLQNSGYVIVKSDEYSLIADLAQVGPSYQPGHAHADSLSYEFSLANQRVFVNSGISEYGLREERLRQRKTAAHNTVVVNNLDSSQVWSGFRVAKRANILNRMVNCVVDNRVCFSAAHNGFKKQGVNCIHHRDWLAENGSVTVTDRLIGNYKSALGYLHLHPEIEVVNITDVQILLASNDFNILIKFTGASVSIEDSTWHPQFGIIINNKRLCFSFTQNNMTIAITWNKK